MRLYKVNRVVWNNVEQETERETTFVVADDIEGVLDELDDPYTQEIDGITMIADHVKIHDPEESGYRGD